MSSNIKIEEIIVIISLSGIFIGLLYKLTKLSMCVTQRRLMMRAYTFGILSPTQNYSVNNEKTDRLLDDDTFTLEPIDNISNPKNENNDVCIEVQEKL